MPDHLFDNDTSALAPVIAQCFWIAGRCDQPGEFWTNALPLVANAIGADSAAVYRAEAGRWTVLAAYGPARQAPVGLLGEVLDQDAVGQEADWVAAPLPARAEQSEAVALHCSADIDRTLPRKALKTLAAGLAEAIRGVRQRQESQQRIRRLEAILQVANQWNRTREVEPLLVQMAEAATRLFGADRASIFLWDRPRRILIGRPSLGVEGGELRIPDDRGVVGRVVHTGQPLRADAADAPDPIDHRTDLQTGYRTRNVLCVPLRGRHGELFGAFELINKVSGSFTAEDEAGLLELAEHAAAALENVQDRQQLLCANRQIADQAAEQVRMIGQSPAIRALRSVVQRVAATDLPVLIVGENGTGKEIVAQMIHYLSARRQKPLVPVNCAAIPDTLAESELFGHEKGAFTDAQETRPGKFELAADGTLFLDEIGDLSLSSQSKLLRVLEEKVLVRVGGSTPIPTDARVLAATNQDLAEMVRQKRFREDLYFRLNVVSLEIPPLRQRAEDVMILAEHFLADFCKKARRPPPRFSAAARQRLESHSWPGNVRELRNLMERLAYLCPSDIIDVDDLAFILPPRRMPPLLASPHQTLAAATAQFQVAYIQQAIEQAGNNVSQAAAKLGLHRSNLYRKMRQLHMTPP